MTLRQLRGWCPEYTWRAVRDGFGYVYSGTRGDESVTVRAYSVLCGPADDDCATQWRVESDGKPIVEFAAWWIRTEARS